MLQVISEKKAPTEFLKELLKASHKMNLIIIFESNCQSNAHKNPNGFSYGIIKNQWNN